MNFRPYLNGCFYCDVEYDMIGRLEEYEEDILFIAMRQNMTSQMRDLTKAMNKIASGDESSMPLRILEYMSQIPQKHKDELFQLYKIDFEMFDYEYKQFL